MSDTDTAPAPRALGPLRSPPFRLLMTAQTVNAFGQGITPVALAFAVLDLGGSATQLGLVVAAYALAEVVTVLFGGVLGDRLPRTVMLQGSNSASAGLQAVVAASLIGGWSSVGLLAALGLVGGCLSSLGQPSSRAITQQTVTPEQLPSAVSLRRISANTAVAGGFAVAGVLVAAFGSGWAIAIDAATFAFASLCFSRLRVPPLPAPVRERILADLRSGAAEVFRHAWLWVLIVQALVYHLFYGGAQGVLGPIVVKRVYGEPAWGWALGALMVGFIVGGLTTLRFRPRRGLYAGTALLAFTALFPLALALHPALGLLLLGAFAHGFGLEIFSVNWDLAIQQHVDPAKLSRVYSFDIVGSFVARPLGLALTGLVAETVGFSDWLLVIAAVMFVSTLVALAVPDVRRIERLP
ncbi:MAG TPA: MFS transporter [Nocardioidaceae bacterium]|nr:MFS transporter [Nocardioidaceae bacterium]